MIGYGRLVDVLSDKLVLWEIQGWYIDENNVVISLYRKSDVGYILKEIYQNCTECDITLRHNYDGWENVIIVKNVLDDVDDKIKYLNNFYENEKYENCHEFKRKDNVIFKYSYVYVEYNDGNISEIIDGDWNREYETISINDLLKEYKKIKNEIYV